MNLLAVFDVATKHPTAVDRVITGCDERELGELILGLLNLFTYAAHQMSTKLGRVAILSQLHRFADRSDGDWCTESAARMSLAYLMMADGVDSALRDHGAYLLEQQVNTANVSDQVHEVIICIVDVWRSLLPALDRDLLAHFVTELDRG